MKKYSLYILVSTLAILLGISAFVLLLMFGSIITEALLLPEDYLFYEGEPLFTNFFTLLFATPIVIFIFCVNALAKEKIMGTGKNEEESSGMWLWGIFKKLGKWNILIAAVWLFLCYVVFTSITYVTPDKIVKVSPFNLVGEEYSYSDVEKIEAGFGLKKRSFYEYEKKGNFYYKIYLDGEMTVFSVPTVNPEIERYSDDSYLEFEEFDTALTALDIHKKSSTNGYENCELDDCYVERFLRIVRNIKE